MTKNLQGPGNAAQRRNTCLARAGGREKEGAQCSLKSGKRGVAECGQETSFSQWFCQDEELPGRISGSLEDSYPVSFPGRLLAPRLRGYRMR